MISVFAPGRVELLGNHTDYNEGVVLGAAIDLGLTVSGSSRSDQDIHIRSKLMGSAHGSISDLKPQTVASWANYALGVARELLELGIPLDGFEMNVVSSLPSGSGLSSSAAFEIATALFLLKLHQRELPPISVATLCQRAEQRFVGVKSGLLDQVMSIFGRANHVMFFDSRTQEVQHIPFPSNVALIIGQSGTERELSSGEYNIRREETHAAAQALGVRALRDVSSSDVAKNANLDPLLRRRARHVVEENERVRRAVNLLRCGDVAGLGRLLNESHESSRRNFENSTPELDVLVQLAREQPGVLGARLTGAGFGGAIVALCENAQARTGADLLQKAYRQATGIHSDMFVCEIGDGAR